MRLAVYLSLSLRAGGRGAAAVATGEEGKGGAAGVELLQKHFKRGVVGGKSVVKRGSGGDWLRIWREERGDGMVGLGRGDAQGGEGGGKVQLLQ